MTSVCAHSSLCTVYERVFNSSIAASAQTSVTLKLGTKVVNRFQFHLRVHDNREQPSFSTRCHYPTHLPPGRFNCPLLAIHRTANLVNLGRAGLADPQSCQSPADRRPNRKFRQSFLKLIMDLFQQLQDFYILYNRRYATLQKQYENITLNEH